VAAGSANLDHCAPGERQARSPEFWDVRDQFLVLGEHLLAILDRSKGPDT
jgi:hypothetical protein